MLPDKVPGMAPVTAPVMEPNVFSVEVMVPNGMDQAVMDSTTCTLKTSE